MISQDLETILVSARSDKLLYFLNIHVYSLRPLSSFSVRVRSGGAGGRAAGVPERAAAQLGVHRPVARLQDGPVHVLPHHGAHILSWYDPSLSVQYVSEKLNNINISI